MRVNNTMSLALENNRALSQFKKDNPTPRTVSTEEENGRMELSPLIRLCQISKSQRLESLPKELELLELKL